MVESIESDQFISVSSRIRVNQLFHEPHYQLIFTPDTLQSEIHGNDAFLFLKLKIKSVALINPLGLPDEKAQCPQPLEDLSYTEVEDVQSHQPVENINSKITDLQNHPKLRRNENYRYIDNNCAIVN